MKRLVALLLSVIMILTGCGQAQPPETTDNQAELPPFSTDSSTPFVEPGPAKATPQFNSPEDKQFLAYVEDSIYEETVSALDSEEYFVENISSVYISKEYLDEVVFNSRSNIYFGYTLSELDEIYQGARYIFTLGEDGTTTVQELQTVEDDSTRAMLTNIAIGTGVILTCITVSFSNQREVAGIDGIAAPGVGTGAGGLISAVNIILATPALSAATFGASFASIGGISAGIVKGIETGEFNEALEAAALGATEGFKWGAIVGAIASGVYRGIKLFGDTKQNDFTIKDCAKIQRESHYPFRLIKQFRNMTEYQVCRDANLRPIKIGDKIVLYRDDIDPNRLDAEGRTNKERAQEGLAPLDATGKSYQLHHVGQKDNGYLAILTPAEHQTKGLHTSKNDEPIDHGAAWSATASSIWKNIPWQ